MEEKTRWFLERRIKGSLQSYLEGTQTFNWIVGIIQGTGLRGQGLKDIFERLQTYGDPIRFKQVYDHCEKEGWLN